MAAMRLGETIDRDQAGRLAGLAVRMRRSTVRLRPHWPAKRRASRIGKPIASSSRPIVWRQGRGNRITSPGDPMSEPQAT
jgi:hypothetical protein